MLLDGITCITRSVTGNRRIYITVLNRIAACLKTRLCIETAVVDICTQCGNSLLKILLVAENYEVIVSLTCYKTVIEDIDDLPCEFLDKSVSCFESVLLVNRSEILDIKINEYLAHILSRRIS